MAGNSTHEVTLLLRDWRRGDRAVLDRLIPLVHRELHRLAHRYMARFHEPKHNGGRCAWGCSW